MDTSASDPSAPAPPETGEVRAPGPPHLPGWSTPPGAGLPATGAAWAPLPATATSGPGWTPAPATAGPGWTAGAPGMPWPSSPPGSRPAARTSTPSARRGAAGGVGAALLALVKYGAVLLKAGKLAPTLISMLLSLWFFTTIFGAAFGVGVVALIAVHESGHMLFAKYEGLPVTAPIFLGPLGALIRLKQRPRDVRQEAVVAIGGPVVGSLGALACLLWAESLLPGHTRNILLALAFTGFFLNLFNLVPAHPLDGGRVASAVSVWFNVAGLVLMGALFLGLLGTTVRPNPFLLVLLVVGAITTVQRVRGRDRAYLSVPARTRVAVGVAYAAMLGICAVGMTVAHNALVDSGVVSVADASTSSGGNADAVVRDLAATTGIASTAVSDCARQVDDTCVQVLRETDDITAQTLSDAAAQGTAPGTVAAVRAVRTGALEALSATASGDAAALDAGLAEMRLGLGALGDGSGAGTAA